MAVKAERRIPNDSGQGAVLLQLKPLSLRLRLAEAESVPSSSAKSFLMGGGWATSWRRTCGDQPIQGCFLKIEVVTTLRSTQ